MATIQLLQQRVREMHLRNEIKSKGQMQLKSNFNFNVKYAPNGQSCVATIYQSFEDKGENGEFSVSLTLEGIFSCQGVETEADKKQVHIMAYDALFPYLQSSVGQAFASTGIPGFMVKRMNLDADHVVLSQGKKAAPPTLPIV